MEKTNSWRPVSEPPEKWDCIEKIEQMVSDETLFLALAEEAAELVQAALKMHRVLYRADDDPTDVGIENAELGLLEEMTDVSLCTKVYEMKYEGAAAWICKRENEKIKKWLARLEERGAIGSAK